MKYSGGRLNEYTRYCKACRVSASTVSKVMNGKDHDISEKTKKKVLQVIEEEHYVPYSKFLEKEGLKNHLIGLVIKKDHRERETIVLSTEKAAGEEGYSLVVSYAQNEEEIPACVEEIERKQISEFDRFKAMGFLQRG